MDIDDIPILRHLRLFEGLIKVGAILFCVILFPALSLAAIEGYHNRSYSPEARRYFVLKAIMWAAVSWIYITFMQCIMTNLVGGPDPMDGHWFFFSWPYSQVVGAPRNHWFYNEALLMAVISGITWAWAAWIGEENSSGAFIPRGSY